MLHNRLFKRLITSLVVLSTLMTGFTVAQSSIRSAPAVSANLVISQIYGAGGNGGATYTNDYIEIFNRGSTAASLNGLSLQYASSTGTGNFGATATQITVLPNVSLAAGQYYLVAEAGGATGSPLPTPDLTAANPIAMAAGAGKVVLANTTTTLGCNGSSNPCNGTQTALIIDLVGYGTGTNYFEGSGPTPSPTATNSVFRAAAGCTDSDNNASDFAAAAAAPRNTSTALNPCAGGPTNTPTITNTPGGATNTPSSTPTITATPSQTNTPVVGTVRIHDIQGAAHRSPLVGTSVTGVPGIVTARESNGFFMQDPNPDANIATSEGVFVFTSSAPTVAVGDSVLVSGNVQEFRPGGAATSLSVTEIGSPSISTVSNAVALPTPVVIGTGGRIPPTTVIDDDATGNVETSGTFDATTDGIDFYESMEGMRVQMNNAVATGPTSDFSTNNEIAVIGDNGANASVRTPRGGIIVQPTDFNPERLILNDLITGGPNLPLVNVGDTFPGAIIGVMDYNFNNFKLQVTTLPAVVSGGITKESTTAAPAGYISIGTFNVENLDPSDGATKFNTLASLIVNNLKAPDVLVIEEVQDNNGATNDSVVDATTTWNTLITAISTAGGPTYVFRQINPVDDADGGEPGGNIRQGFLYRTDRGVAFVDRAGGTSTAAVSVNNAGGVPQLSFSPGRIDPTNSAWSASRKPLAGEFTYAGKTFFVVGNHFNSKGGDDPLFGANQPPTLSSEVQRHQQATIVNNFVDQILAIDPNADIVVAGDLNDYQFSDTISILKGSPTPVLNDLIDTLPVNERYSYDYEGNAQTLDHLLLSDHFFSYPRIYDVVHVNSEFADQASDHDPQIVQINSTAATATPSSTATTTPTDSATATPSTTATDTPTNTATATASNTATNTPNDTPTNTLTPTLTNTPVNTATSTRTATVTISPTPTITPAPTQTVNWIDLVKVVASGNTITKTTTSGQWDAGGAADKQFTNGDGFAQMTVADTTRYTMFGLAHNHTTTDYTELNYAIYTYANTGELAIYENGVYKAGIPGYAVGDILKVSIESGVIKYYKNATLLYTSTQTPVFPLLIVGDIFSQGGQISNAIIGGASLSAVTPWTPTATATATLPPVPLTATPVTWIDQVKVTASANTLIKTGTLNAWDAGAASDKQIASGDGYVQMTINDTTRYLMFGLATSHTGTAFAEINYAVYTYANTGDLAVYENGVYKAGITGYSAGDVIKVAIEGGLVKYYKNGALLYSSSVAPSYPLRAVGDIFTPAGQVNNALIAGTLSAATPWTPTPSATPTNTPQPLSCNNVTFANLVNASASGNTLTKTSPVSAWNAGATSSQNISGGDGNVSETINDTVSYTMFGLGSGNNNGNYTGINYAIYTYASTGQLAIYESGAYRGNFGSYAIGDVIKVAVEGVVVNYYKNANLLYTSTIVPGYPLLLNAAINTPGGKINNAQICGNNLTAFANASAPQDSNAPAGAAPTLPAKPGAPPAAPVVPNGGRTVVPAAPVVPRDSGVPARPVVPALAAGFSDVPVGSPFYSYVMAAQARGILSGYADGTFRPMNMATRAQAAKIVVLAFGWSLTRPGAGHFSDVAANDPFYAYVETAYNHNLLSGYADGTFRPYAGVTRGQFAKLVVQAAGLAQLNPAQASFSDVPRGSAFFGYVEAAKAGGLLSGYADGTFKPGAGATRGQIAKIIVGAAPTR